MNEQRRLSEESDRFCASGDSHDLPEIANWFSQNILSHELIKHTGSRSFQELVLQGIKNARKSNREFVLVSLGSGHGQIENELLEMVPSISPGNTHFYAIDLFSPNDSVETQTNGHTYRLTRISQNLNNPTFPKNADMIIVHHALHHFVALEEIFESIYEILLANSGSLIIADMVGRNGHMRWPESLRAINRIWKALPEDKKFNNQFQKTWSTFENWDCSSEGFEGIRSEDITKILMKHFESHGSFFWGGVLDPFIDRGFGDNFDPKNHKDLDTIKNIISVENQLQNAGYLTATQVIGKFTPRNVPLTSSFTNFFVSKKFLGELLPSVKDHIDEIVDSCFEPPRRHCATSILEEKLLNTQLVKYLLGGWDTSDPSIIWGVGLESQLTFSFNGVQLSCLQFDCFILERAKFGLVHILVNGSISISQQLTPSTLVYLPPLSIETLEISFKFSKIESLIESKDKRLITFYISQLTFYQSDRSRMPNSVPHPTRLKFLGLKIKYFSAKYLIFFLPRKSKTILKALYSRLLNNSEQV